MKIAPKLMLLLVVFGLVTTAADKNQQSANQVLVAAKDISSRADELKNVVDEFLDKVAAA